MTSRSRVFSCNQCVGRRSVITPTLPHHGQPVRLAPLCDGLSIDPGDHKGVSRSEKVELDLAFGSAVASRAARLFSTDHVAAACLQRATLQAEVLVDRRDTGIAVVSSVSDDSRRLQGIVSEFLQQLY
jgi:hypothetical protein